jgi:hypothetical protein
LRTRPQRPPRSAPPRGATRPSARRAFVPQYHPRHRPHVARAAEIATAHHLGKPPLITRRPRSSIRQALCCTGVDPPGPQCVIAPPSPVPRRSTCRFPRSAPRAPSDVCSEECLARLYSPLAGTSFARTPVLGDDDVWLSKTSYYADETGLYRGLEGPIPASEVYSYLNVCLGREPRGEPTSGGLRCPQGRRSADRTGRMSSREPHPRRGPRQAGRGLRFLWTGCTYGVRPEPYGEARTTSVEVDLSARSNVVLGQTVCRDCSLPSSTAAQTCGTLRVVDMTGGCPR